MLSFVKGRGLQEVLLKSCGLKLTEAGEVKAPEPHYHVGVPGMAIPLSLDQRSLTLKVPHTLLQGLLKYRLQAHPRLAFQL